MSGSVGNGPAVAALTIANANAVMAHRDLMAFSPDGLGTHRIPRRGREATRMIAAAVAA